MTAPKRVVPPRLMRLVAAAPVSDTDLLAQFIRSQDGAAFAALVERHGPMVLRTCRRTLWDAHAAEDAFQATFLALVRGAHRVRKAASVASWLHGTAVRISLKAKGTAARGPRPSDPSAARCEPDPLAAMTGRELVSAVDEELVRLPERYQVVITLCCLEGLSQEEAARRLGCSVASVKGRLERGRERLRARLARRGLALSAGLGGLLFDSARAEVPPRLFARAAELAAPGTASPSVAALAAAGAPAHATWPAVAVAVVVLAVGGAAALGYATPPRTPEQQPAEATRPADAPLDGSPRRQNSGPPAKTDRYGDPLPAGALMRLGTLRGAATVMSFGVTADGAVLTVGEEGDLRLWQPEADTPEPAVRLPVRVPDEWHGRFHSYISSDAKRVACCAPESVIVFERRGENVPAEIGKFKFPPVESLAFAPDSKKLVVVTRNRKGNSESIRNKEKKENEYAVHVADIQTGQSRALVTDLSYIREVRFSADGRRVAVNTFDELLVFDVGTGKELARWSVDGFKLDRVALNTTGDVVAARLYKEATEEHLDVRFFEATTGKAQKGAVGTDGGDWVTFAPDGKTVLIGDARGVRWWDPIAGRLLRQFDGASGELLYGETSVARFTPDGKVLVATTGRVLFRWDAATGKPLFAGVHAASLFGSVHALGVSADGTRYATSAGSRIRVWDAATGKPVATVPSVNQWPHNLEFSRNGKTLFAPVGGEIVQWDAATGTELRRFAVDPKEPRQEMVIGLRLSDDDKTLTGVTLGRVKGTLTSVFTTWDARSGGRQFTKKLDPFDWSAGRCCINFSPNALYASLYGDVFLTADGPTKGLLPPRTLGPGFAAGAFSADGGRIAFTYIDESDPRGVMRGVVYGVATGAKLCDLPAGSGGRVALNSDGSVLAAAGLTDLTFWDTSTGKLLARHRSPPTEKGDTMYSNSFAEVMRFTADGTKLITGHADTTALVWPVPAGAAK
ncbi:ECF RNA polymerase sigma factor SigE [Gemmata obscuriglobus]|uniref:RNA polymerase sigma factor n=1 Tax=Gemmata obscuriglobus TaxID=114 RepID=A0A2Z3GZD7_9BACT|nr:sigma-70 family RNA polymerase sigma factor [Gemmata obscuriglobus]AWM36225.1 RNA polymerase sigma factor [Gemmata obscuriglobus]QEG31173.1 ECF RNA polymerase sigma factor SigE [Gemmata obscuriglobus]VTS10511.1 sigma-70 family rna polymerase sigma factor : Uncultured bacterium genome assembly Metasoil_fosmids_resub OS=uncultured bacterium PE=4 SV=1: Sigma70_r2: Sigma70_r4_2 [Gemmata obscuriglobus UQM 2246]